MFWKKLKAYIYLFNDKDYYNKQIEKLINLAYNNPTDGLRHLKFIKKRFGDNYYEKFEQNILRDYKMEKKMEDKIFNTITDKLGLQ